MRKLRCNVMIGLALVLTGLAATAWASSPVPAAVVDSAVVPVSDTSTAVRKTAFGTALLQVLAQRLGHPVAAGETDALTAKAATWVQQYQYARSAAGGTGYQLTVAFADPALDQLVHRLRTPTGMGAGGNQTAGMGASGTNALVSVSGVGSAQDFAGALAALRALPGVQKVVVRAANGGNMLLDVTAAAPVGQVLVKLGAGGGLVPAGAQLGAQLGLRWQG